LTTLERSYRILRQALKKSLDRRKTRAVSAAVVGRASYGRKSSKTHDANQRTHGLRLFSSSRGPDER
jgi:hypothetical protein